MAIAITGMGCICPYGNDTHDSTLTYLSQACAVKKLEDTSIVGNKPFLAASVDYDFRSALGGFKYNRLDRCTHMALVAAREAWLDADIENSGVDVNRISVVIGTGIGGQSTLLTQMQRHLSAKRLHPMFIPMVIPNTTSAQISIEFGCTGGAHTVASACASGSEAIAHGCQLLATNQADVVIVGGTESPINPVTFQGFDDMGALAKVTSCPQESCRPFSSNRNGFVLGEGAGILILERVDDAKTRDIEIKGKILGSGISSDAYHLASPLSDGKYAAISISKALAAADLQPSDIDMISAHATGTISGDLAESLAIKRVFKTLSDVVPVSAPKAGLGHLLGGSGAVETILTINALRMGFIPASLNSLPIDPYINLNIPLDNIKIDINRTTIALKNNFAFGGHNVSLIISN